MIMGVSDKNYEGEVFYCPDCTMLEGFLAKNPNLREFIDVVYIGFEKSRQELITVIGDVNQSLPVLVLPEGVSLLHQTGFTIIQPIFLTWTKLPCS